jgi:hypothetical protein
MRSVTKYSGSRGDTTAVIITNGPWTVATVKMPSGSYVAMTTKRGTITNAADVIAATHRVAKSFAGVA